MKIFKKRSEISEEISKLKAKGLKIGFVPTMGALHEGHISLVKMAQTLTDVVVMSIFVNPTQFNDPTDFSKYPQPIERDQQLLMEHNCDLLWLPTREEIYPSEYEKHKNIHLNFEGLDQKLEGVSRPGHFEGVIEVVSILFDVIQPDKAFFGQKDFQQLALIQSLATLAYPEIEIIPVATFRELNGLAMSSRNERLSSDGKHKAGFIFKTLSSIQDAILKANSPVAVCLQNGSNKLEEEAFRVDYVALVDSSTLDRIETPYLGQKLTLAVAVFFEGIRLIDNIQFIYIHNSESSF